MDEETEFMELLRIQDNLDMITKREMLTWAKKKGLPMTDRKLTSLMTEGLLPKTARIGSRGGAYPAIAKEQLRFVLKVRGRGVPVPCVKEVLPVWRYLTGAVLRREIVIAELEDVVQGSIVSDQALHLLPMVIQEALPCHGCKSDQLSEIKFKYKDDSVHSRGTGEDISFALLFEEMDGSGECRRRMTARITLPREDEENDPSTIMIRRVAESKLQEPADDEREAEIERGEVA